MSNESKSRAVPEENKMGVMPVGRLLFSMSLPMMLSMLVQALYNIVDSIFVAKLSEDALSAVSLAFPLQTLIFAVGGGTCVGVNALLSRALGEKDFKKANDVAMNGAFLTVLSYVVFLILGLTVVKPFYVGQLNGTSSPIYGMGVDYLSTVMIFSIGVFCQMYFERLLTSTGKTVYTMLSQLTGAVINIILDPILIFGLLGAPAMGVTGAAVATVIGQCGAAILSAVFNVKFNHEVDLKIKGFRPSAKIIGPIYAIGIPSIIMQSIGSVMTYCMNRILIGFSSTATAVFGVYFKLQSFFFMPVFGLNNGITPIIAYNYGAGHKDRVIKTIKHSVAYGVGIMFVGLLAMHIFPAQLMRMFDAEESLIAIGAPALETISLSFVFAGFCIVAGSVFQALGNGVYSMIVSVARQMCVLLPVAKLLSLSGEVTLIWWAFPIAELASVLLTSYFLVRIYRKVICHIGEPVVQDA